MRKFEIIELLAKEKRVEKHVCNISHCSLNDELRDLCQLVYSILLDYDDASIVRMWEKGQLDFFMTRIIMNQYRSTSSPFYITFRKFRLKCVSISEYREEPQQ
ncbi:MAG: hypothetical protein K2J62_00485 [Bacteroidales bacterium]|nr:hypothetical protein [Bacteroidales bacterium]